MTTQESAGRWYQEADASVDLQQRSNGLGEIIRKTQHCASEERWLALPMTGGSLLISLDSQSFRSIRSKRTAPKQSDQATCLKLLDGILKPPYASLDSEALCSRFSSAGTILQRA